MLEVYPNYKSARPHTVVSVDSSRIGNNSSDSQKAIVVFGSAASGIPGELYHLTSFPQAKSIFKSGELLDWIEIAWSPSDTFAGAGDIYAMRVDEAKPASLVNAGVEYRSVQYGEDANKVAIKLENGDVANSFKLTALDTNTNETEVYNNLGPIMNVSYMGEEVKATLSISKGHLILTEGDNDVAVADLNLKANAYATADKLVTAINGTAIFSASLVPEGDKAIDSIDLDDVENVELSESDYTLYSVRGDLVHQTEYSALVNALLVEDNEDEDGNAPIKITPKADEAEVEENEDAKKPVIEAFSLRTLEGGTNGDVPASWADKFQLLANEDAPYAYYLAAVTPNQAIHNELGNFVTTMSNAGYPVRGIVGGDQSETITKILARKAALYNPRIALVGSDTQIKMADGRLLYAPAYMSTALVAGIVSGLPIGEPATYKQIRVTALKSLYTSDQLDQLHNAGVVTFEKVRNIASSAFRIVSDVTTYNNANDPVESQMSLGEETDYLANAVREKMDSTYIGTRTSALTAGVMKATIDTLLSQQVSAGMIQSYSAADISVSIIGDTANITFVVVPARGLNTIKVGIIYDTATVTA